MGARLAELKDCGGAAGQWFCDRSAIYEGGARQGLRLDEAAGLIPKPEQDSWWAAECRLRRDELLRTIAVRWYAGERSPASKIATALRRYQAAGSLRDRPYRDPPKSYRGTVRELLFHTLKQCGPAPGRRTIERALSARNPAYL